MLIFNILDLFHNFACTKIEMEDYGSAITKETFFG